MHTSKSGWLTIAAVLVLALSTAACEGQPLDRAGGTATTDARTLTFAIRGDAPDPPLLALADLVDELSDGSLTIAFENMGERPMRRGRSTTSGRGRSTSHRWGPAPSTGWEWTASKP